MTKTPKAILKLFCLAMIALSAVKVQADDVELKHLKDQFRYPAPYGITQMKEIRPFGSYIRQLLIGRYRQYEGNFISYTPEGSVYFNHYQYYKSIRPGKRPLVVILPVIGGVTLVETTMAKHLASRGIHALIPHMTEDISDITRPLEDFDSFLIRATTAVRSALDLWTEREEVDAERIGGVGSSLGGIRLLITMGIDSRIKAGATFVAGGDLPEILTRSDIDFFKELKKNTKLKEGLHSDQEYTELLRKHISIDPLVFAKNIDKRDVTMAISDNDTTVPTKNQYMVWEEYNRPYAYLFKKPGHTLSVILSLTKRAQIVRFLNERWMAKGSKSLESQLLLAEPDEEI
jgi:hypothetical protein